MKIGPIDTQSRDGSIECSAVVESHSGACAAQRVWFRVAEEHAALVDASTANAFVAGLFLAAMAAGEDVQASDPICPALGGNLWSMSRIVGTWPRTPSWRVRPMSVRIHGPTAPSGASIAPTGVGCFFTLGVDSLFALLNEPAIDHLIYVVGYDCPLSNRPLRAEIERRVHDVSVRTGRTAVIVETNLREFTEPLVSWPSNHGAALAAAGLFLGGGLQRVHIASSDAYITRAPYGTHPDIDPLWSSARTRFVSQGTGFTRLAKIGQIAKDPLFRENVRVCWANRPGRYNCRDCMKCLRTMLQLRHWGQLETCSTLAGPMPWHILDTAIEPQHRWFIWEDLLKGFADDDEGRAARARVLAMLERSRGTRGDLARI
jgi:hypothetical protein